jgi:hypothetical protein
MSKNKSKVKKADVVSGGLDNVQVRVSKAEAQYVPLITDNGVLVSSGDKRVTDVHPDVMRVLAEASAAGCALYAVDGGLRVMRNANGVGGVLFIERKKATSKSPQLFCFPPATRESCEALGLTVLHESKGVYVAPCLESGETAFKTILDGTNNNHSPVGFVVHPWPGLEVAPLPEKKAKKEKANKPVKEKAKAKKVKGKVLFEQAVEEIESAEEAA